MINATGIPGSNATAGMVMITPELPALVFFMDQGNFAIQLPATPDGPGVMARLCRETAEEAIKIAEFLESAHGLVSDEHRTDEPWFSESGSGCEPGGKGWHA